MPQSNKPEGSNLSREAIKGKNAQEKHSEFLEQMEHAMDRILETADGKILKRHLDNIVNIQPYSPGVTLDALAYHEGHRELALGLLGKRRADRG